MAAGAAGSALIACGRLGTRRITSACVARLLRTTPAPSAALRELPADLRREPARGAGATERPVGDGLHG